MYKTLISLIILPAVLICLAKPADGATAAEFLDAMARQLSCYPLQLVEVENQEIAISNEELCLAAVYTATGMKPLWVTENGPGANAALILQFLRNAASEGLRPSDYNVPELEILWHADEADHLASLDTLLTLNFIKYAHDVSRGRILPYTTDPELFAEAGDLHFKPVQVVEQALAAPDLADFLDSLPPAHEYYRKLRQALGYYRDIAEAGGWQKVAAGATLRPGDRDERLRQVRRRLAGTGGTAAAGIDETFYDEELVPVIKTFQKRFGLEEDGIIGRQTLAALNTSPTAIINRIMVNMARWRWQESELGRRHIMVNIANYDLKAVADGREVMEMAVIVGKLQHQTPVFSRRVQYVEFNPFWNIPPNIAANEDLPALRRDPFYLVNRKVRLFSGWQDDAVELDSTAIDWQTVSRREMKRYKLRQDPGPWNALGPVKFVFPNEYNVYIHGTPEQELFDHNNRNFSHGCIRASKPLELAVFVLSEEEAAWPLEKIAAAADSGERKVVRLSEDLPVHITYQTVWVDKSGIIHFNDDVYGRDQKLAEILFAATDSEADITSTTWDNE